MTKTANRTLDNNSPFFTIEYRLQVMSEQKNTLPEQQDKIDDLFQATDTFSAFLNQHFSPEDVKAIGKASCDLFQTADQSKFNQTIHVFASKTTLSQSTRNQFINLASILLGAVIGFLVGCSLSPLGSSIGFKVGAKIGATAAGALLGYSQSNRFFKAESTEFTPLAACPETSAFLKAIDNFRTAPKVTG